MPSFFYINFGVGVVHSRGSVKPFLISSNAWRASSAQPREKESGFRTPAHQERLAIPQGHQQMDPSLCIGWIQVYVKDGSKITDVRDTEVVE